MKLIIQNSRIAATATNAYAGPDFSIEAPADFDMGRMSDYRYDADTGLKMLVAATKTTGPGKRVVVLECYISAEKTVPDTIDQAILEPDLQTIDDDNDKANEGSVAQLRHSHRGG